MPVYRALRIASGARSIEFLGKAIAGIDSLRRYLRAASKEAYLETRIERDLRAEIGDAEVASLSNDYNWAAGDGLRLKLMPIPQRYSAYGPYLDHLNAEWIRDHGPRFLIWDGQAIDNRNAIAETPAEWAEVYRWYSLKRLGTRNMLLERRSVPRRMVLQPIWSGRRPLADGVDLPDTPGPMFLAMRCPLTMKGRIRYLVGGVPELRISLTERDSPSRIIPSVMQTPALINYWPQSLQELARLFEDGNERLPWLSSRLNFEGPGMGSYGPTCSYELYRLSAAENVLQ
jgi:hypothetical protein